MIPYTDCLFKVGSHFFIKQNLNNIIFRYFILNNFHLPAILGIFVELCHSVFGLIIVQKIENQN